MARPNASRRTRRRSSKSPGRGQPRGHRGRAVPLRADVRSRTTSCASELSDRTIPVSGAPAIIEDLLAGRASSHDGRDRVAARRRRTRLTTSRDRRPLRRDRGGRTVSTRSPRCAPRCRSTPSSSERLAAALSQATGKQVEVKVIVDENVLGGIVARIGDTVIDGTVRHRLGSAEGTHLMTWRVQPSIPTTSPRRCASTSRASSPTSSRSAWGASSRSATASRACRACPTRPSTSCSSSKAAPSASR